MDRDNERRLRALEQAVLNEDGFLDVRDADTTPSVGGGVKFLLFANTGATVVTGFDEGKVAQEIVCQFTNGNTSFDFTGTTLKGNAGADFTASQYDMVRCVKGRDGYWRCVVGEG